MIKIILNILIKTQSSDNLAKLNFQKLPLQ